MNLLKSTVAASLLVGAALGIGGYTFIYAEGASYLTNEPSACANCHVMDDHYAAWTKSSHRDVATCNDCHTPHDGVVAKYTAKATSGARHATAFTFGGFPDNLLISDSGARITEQNCRHCHDAMVSTMSAAHAGGEHEDGMSCVRCHADVGHQAR